MHEQSRYLALVLFPDGSTRAADLGPAAPIDTATTHLRDALAHREVSFRDAMRSLRASRPHPYHWAPFIALGSDAPLHAIVPSTHPERGE